MIDALRVQTEGIDEHDIDLAWSFLQELPDDPSVTVMLRGVQRKRF